MLSLTLSLPLPLHRSLSDSQFHSRIEKYFAAVKWIEMSHDVYDIRLIYIRQHS